MVSCNDIENQFFGHFNEKLSTRAKQLQIQELKGFTKTTIVYFNQFSYENPVTYIDRVRLKHPHKNFK